MNILRVTGDKDSLLDGVLGQGDLVHSNCQTSSAGLLAGFFRNIVQAATGVVESLASLSTLAQIGVSDQGIGVALGLATTRSGGKFKSNGIHHLPFLDFGLDLSLGLEDSKGL